MERRPAWAEKPGEPPDLPGTEIDTLARFRRARGQGIRGERKIQGEIGERRPEFMRDPVDEGDPLGGELQGAGLVPIESETRSRENDGESGSSCQSGEVVGVG